ncbi:MAG TPA: M64 family metallopeptidase [Candidatus Saccharicenans sp.]|nr:M64 family metallopeptidase [Candidatus Saccharicenans sp.]
MKSCSASVRQLSKLKYVALIFSVFLGLLILWPLSAPAQEPPQWPEVESARLIAYQVTGPASERLNFILMADGYQANEVDKFLRDVDRNLAVMWTMEPFRTYRYYINVYLLEIVSKDSGIRRDPGEDAPPEVRDAKNTALRLWYEDGLTNPLARGVTYGPAPLNSPPGTRNGDEQRTWYLKNYVAPELGLPVDSQNLQTLAIANTFTYGGIGGFHATTTGGSPQGPLVSIHELGHSLGLIWDDYPYIERNVWRGCWKGGEPDSVTHTIYTSTEKMIADQHKWWRWIGEDSASAGSPIGLYEGGYNYPCGIRRASEYSMMRWTGYHFDVVQRERMTIRISGMRDANCLPLDHTPESEVGPKDVIWVEPMHPRYHELNVTWRVNGQVIENHNSSNLELSKLSFKNGDIIEVTVSDPTNFVRDPKWINGPRLTQSRKFTVGKPLPSKEVKAKFTRSTPTIRPVGGQEVVFVETTHPADSVLTVSWSLNGKVLANPFNSRCLNLAKLNLPQGTFKLTATLADPAEPNGRMDSLTWYVDNALPTVQRKLSKPLTTIADRVEHNVYFNEFEMLLEPRDDQTGYDQPLYVAAEFKLDGGGWYNYFGFPDKPMGTPFKFTPSGIEVRGLIYGSLGTGGHAKAPFEQLYLNHEIFGTFWPGYGTHTVEHRAIDPAGNIGEPEMFKATVLPGKSPEATTTVTGQHKGTLVVEKGVTLIDGATITGGVVVKPGASLVVSDGSKISGDLEANGAAVIHIFGATVNGKASISGTTDDVIIAGSKFKQTLTVTGSKSQVVKFPSGKLHQYGVALVGNAITGDLICLDNNPGVTDFGAPNNVGGAKKGQAAGL